MRRFIFIFLLRWYNWGSLADICCYILFLLFLYLFITFQDSWILESLLTKPFILCQMVALMNRSIAFDEMWVVSPSYSSIIILRCFAHFVAQRLTAGLMVFRWPSFVIIFLDYFFGIGYSFYSSNPSSTGIDALICWITHDIAIIDIMVLGDKKVFRNISRLFSLLLQPVNRFFYFLISYLLFLNCFSKLG